MRRSSQSAHVRFGKRESATEINDAAAGYSALFARSAGRALEFAASRMPDSRFSRPRVTGAADISPSVLPVVRSVGSFGTFASGREATPPLA